MKASLRHFFSDFLKCGLTGWCMEILFTSLNALRRRDLTLKGQHLHLDVPHLWKCCLSWAPFPPSKKETSFLTGSSLYASYLYHGAFQWKVAFQKEALSLGLWSFPLEYPPPNPLGLCSLMVPCRSFF